jgi:Bacteriophage related domain of unknown function
MASKAVVDAIQGVIGDSWTSIDGTVLAVRGINANGQPPADGSAFLKFSFPVANSNVAGLGGAGSRTIRETGGFAIEVTTPIGNGVDQALGWCDELIALYLTKNIGGSLATYVPSPPSQSTNAVGSYYVLRVAVPYHYDRIG